MWRTHTLQQPVDNKVVAVDLNLIFEFDIAGLLSGEEYQRGPANQNTYLSNNEDPYFSYLDYLDIDQESGPAQPVDQVTEEPAMEMTAVDERAVEQRGPKKRSYLDRSPIRSEQHATGTPQKQVRINSVRLLRRSRTAHKLGSIRSKFILLLIILYHILLSYCCFTLFHCHERYVLEVK